MKSKQRLMLVFSLPQIFDSKSDETEEQQKVFSIEKIQNGFSSTLLFQSESF